MNFPFLIISIFWILIKDIYYSLQNKNKDWNWYKAIFSASIFSLFFINISYEYNLKTTEYLLKFFTKQSNIPISYLLISLPFIIDILSSYFTNKYTKSAVYHRSKMLVYLVQSFTFCAISFTFSVILVFLFIFYALM